MKKLGLSILLLMATPALAQLDRSKDADRYTGCLAAAEAQPKTALQYAVEWQALGGGLPARHCQAIAQLVMGENIAATATLVAAARAAEVEKSPMLADLWGQAGNAALLSGDARSAVGYFNSAVVASGENNPQVTALMLIDRARAQVELKQEALARADIERAMVLSPSDPTAYTLAAALARRNKDLGAASVYVAKASSLAPSDPDVMLEQANVAAANGDLEAAKQLWTAVTKQAPDSEAAAIAKKELAK